jgi:hypothetical protein
MTLSFGIKLFAIDRAKGSQIEVVDIVKSARALVTPVTPGIRPPALCKITYKAMDLYDWECFCTEVSGATPDNIWDVNKNPMTAELTFSFIEVDRKNLGAATYVQGGGRMKTLFSPDLVMGKGGSTLIGGASMFSEEVREGNPNYNEYLRNTGMF